MKTALKKLADPPIKQPRRQNQKIESANVEAREKKVSLPIPKNSKPLSSKKKVSLKTLKPQKPTDLAAAQTPSKTSPQVKPAKLKKPVSGAKSPSKTSPPPTVVKIEEKTAPPVKPRMKTLKPLGKAVFRGKKELYDFKVFSLDEQFEAVQAVYVISKRKTDKNRRAHHLLLCIGQTDSVLEAIKKHRKNRCLKKNEANVISLLREPDAKKRLQIADDLKAAHTIVCNLEELKAES